MRLVGLTNARREARVAMEEWIEEELATVDIGDRRLDRRAARVLQRLAQAPQASIPAACGGLAETTAAYRFFDNARVSAAAILKPHHEATLARIARHGVVLLAQDTTELDYSDQSATAGLGPLNSERRVGLLQHLTLALTPERLSLGVVGARIWGRAALRKRRGAYKREPIERRESVRWLEGYELACQVAARAPATQVVSIADRDGDIYDLFALAAARRAGGAPCARWIVRAKHNRPVLSERRHEGDEEAELVRLREALARQDALGTLEIDLPRTPTRARRTARCTVRALAGATLKPPERSGAAQAKLSATAFNVVWVREEGAPPGQAPIDWLLLSDLAVATFAQATTVVEYYCCRWQIEIFFRVLKSGCRVEKLQLEHEKRLRPAIALYLIVAWRVMFVMGAGRACPQLPCSVLFEEAEWKSLWRVTQSDPLPAQAPSLEKMVAMIASLGGHLGRSGDGPPGPTVIWRGLQRTRDFAEAWRMFGPDSS